MDFDGYFEVLSSAAENYDDKVGSTVRANNCHASMHSTSYDTFNNNPDIFYDVDTDMDTIMANAHNMVLAYYSNGACIPDDTWSRLPQSSREAWQDIPTEDRKLIMGTGNSFSNLMGTPSSSASSNGNRHGCRTFARTRDHRKVSFLNHSADDGMADTEPTDDTDDIDLIDDVLDQYNVDFATLCTNVAEQKNSELIASGKHVHYRLCKCAPNPQVPSVPPGDVRWLLSDKVSSSGDVSINGVPYIAKKVGSSHPAPTDINLEGITYTVKVADLTTYCVSSTSHLDMTGALVDRGTNGGITRSDCQG
jgi:hypothetical protein